LSDTIPWSWPPETEQPPMMEEDPREWRSQPTKTLATFSKPLKKEGKLSATPFRFSFIFADVVLGFATPFAISS